MNKKGFSNSLALTSGTEWDSEFTPTGLATGLPAELNTGDCGSLDSGGGLNDVESLMSGTESQMPDTTIPLRPRISRGIFVQTIEENHLMQQLFCLREKPF